MALSSAPALHSAGFQCRIVRFIARIWTVALVSLIALDTAICAPHRQRLKVNPDLITKSWDPFPVLGFFMEFCQSQLNRTGRCMSLPDCRFSRGTREGDCADGFGVCCIHEVRNNVETTVSNNSYFVQPGFPKPFTGGKNVSLTVLLPSSTCQLRLELEEFRLLPPVAGRCLNDSMRVFVNGSDSYVPELCGHNAGQHVVLHFPENEEHSLLSVSVVTPKSGFERRWSVRIVLYSCGSKKLAQPGCLQHHGSCRGSFRSFAYTEEALHFVRALNYAVCIARPSWLQAISLKIRTVSGYSPAAATRRGDAGNDDGGVGAEQECRSNFIQLPPGYDSRRGLAAPVRICGGNRTVILHMSVQGPLVFYIVSSDGVDQRTQFRVDYSLYPCSESSR
ncbi:hypothetical protein HPB51_020732 [Rhipicephalus microplus]|uniref:CUB domain-containing protein n=2 Tax=Rhipicephalus microplus TaxID=6941 RepID=A0A9J6EBU0_RHIMP|nr:uncharacterized protein LOC119164453 [Rhipicephalus microplus]KAH8031737.1 hypothetical protein HPB51_020732 [Rhipicephalus microplus]